MTDGIEIIANGELAGLPVPAPAPAPPGEPKKRGKAAGSGRKKGTANKVTAIIKHATLMAAENVGYPLDPDRPGLQGYLEFIAMRHPVAFCGLLQKILPHQLATEDGKPVIERIERIIVQPANTDS